MIIHVCLSLKQPLINCSSLDHTLGQITRLWHTQASRGRGAGLGGGDGFQGGRNKRAVFFLFFFLTTDNGCSASIWSFNATSTFTWGWGGCGKGVCGGEGGGWGKGQTFSEHDWINKLVTKGVKAGPIGEQGRPNKYVMLHSYIAMLTSFLIRTIGWNWNGILRV